ncbi:hypothetical protein Tco_0822777 [Tanacetum coccineum]|uniref:Uncharacterized protein n=1 Tax=Tanacetum coccineum TaxID=301880 RepID=A0ABQ5AKB5_9ASTR
MIIHPTTEPINPTTTVTAEENNIGNQAKIQVDNAHVDDNEFYNVFSTPITPLSVKFVEKSFPKSNANKTQLLTDQLNGVCITAHNVSPVNEKNIKEAMVDFHMIKKQMQG